MGVDKVYIVCKKCGNVIVSTEQDTENIVCSKCFEIVVEISQSLLRKTSD